MRTHFQQHQARSIFICCALAASAWMDLAQAAAVRAPNRTVASQFIVVKPGEPDEVRANRARRQSREVAASATAIKTDSVAVTTPPAPGAPAAN